MATSREVDSIGTFEAGAAISQYTFVVLDATTGGWIPATAALAVDHGSIIGVAQQDAVIGEPVNVMIKGQTKLIFPAAIIAGAGAGAGDLFAPVGAGDAGAAIVGVGATAANLPANVKGHIFEQVAVAGNVGSIFLIS